MTTDPTDLLEHAGVRPTSNRILVVRTLLGSQSPLSLIDIETELQTLERSSISRVLSLLLDRHLIHAMEDGRGVVKYEVCSSHDHGECDDSHVHFYCEECEKVFCFRNVSTPSIDVPEGFDVHAVNFMLKGVCPECRRKR